MGLEFISRHNSITLKNYSNYLSRLLVDTLKINRSNFFRCSIKEYSVAKYNNIMYIDGVMLDYSRMGGYAPLSKYKTNNMKRLTKKGYNSMI